MKLENIDIDYIEKFASAYSIDKFIFNGLSNPTPGKQRKFNKWFFKNQMDSSMPSELENYVKSLNRSDLISFLKECYDYIEVNGTKRKQLFNKTAKDLPEDLQNALWTVLQPQYDDTTLLTVKENYIEILARDTVVFEKKLVLLNAYTIPKNTYGSFQFYDVSFEKEDDVYKLVGETVDYSTDNSYQNFTICFTDAKIETQVFSAIDDNFYQIPWDQLICIVESIKLKQNEVPDCFNEKELELLPLLKEIISLFDCYEICEKTYSFPILKGMINELNFSELLPLIKKLECSTLSDSKRNLLNLKLLKKLNTIKYEPLWRKIYNLIVVSQEGYISRAKTKFSKDSMQKKINEIERVFKSFGYEGKYPDFYKKGSLKKFHLINSYNISYTVGHEKNAVFHIHCCKNPFSDDLEDFEFFCGTELLKKNEKAGDIYTCLFNAKGRKFFKQLIFNNEIGEEFTAPLPVKLGIAVKCAELLKLTKEEKSLIFNMDGSLTLSQKLIWFLTVFLLSGFMFASLFIPAMMGFSAFMLWIEGMPVVISDIPWFTFYLGTWAAFGVPMGLLAVFSKK